VRAKCNCVDFFTDPDVQADCAESTGRANRQLEQSFSCGQSMAANERCADSSRRQPARTGLEILRWTKTPKGTLTCEDGAPKRTYPIEVVADHIDTNCRNNYPDNLRRLTRLENALKNPVMRRKIEYLCGSVDTLEHCIDKVVSNGVCQETGTRPCRKTLV
jgi:hypothetical protein